MKLDITRTRKLLKDFDFATLFREELGWDPNRHDLTVTVEGQEYRLQTIAHKRGFMVLWLKGQIPDYATRRKIDAQVTKSYHEHLIVYSDAGQTEQRWQWVKREAGKPAASRESTFRVDGSGDALIQKLEYLAVTLDEEEQLTILDVAERVKSGFNVEKVTKKFYERFKNEHTAFMKFLKGIPDAHFQRWYVSVTLNRLMFVYFVQKKGFLDGDLDYLRHKLAASKQKGENLFYSGFLCPLFFEGFASKKRSAEVRQLLGNVPYLNGGIFERHQIETLYGEKIEIPDAAFEKLFDFFDGYQWHLDERPLRRDNEINPDVLGYIFEKYINQKQMGAYYTKEDITEYISKNTIIPHLFDAAGVADFRSADFRSFKDFGSLLASDPDRYIYAAVRHGIKTSKTSEVWADLPAEIAVGLDDPQQRGAWNKPAPAEAALPTEIWREVIARRRRYLEVREKLTRGAVTSINDLITLNLDIRQFAQDVIENSDADLLLAFWKALTQIKILDPTVGSGAFLFAALNVLEPLYEACLERMRALVEELDRSGEKHSPKKYEPFRKALAQVQQRPDEDYFIFKSIIINNLYGVDIMEEAVEICKLRLFLKLASQVEPDPSKENLGIEPLPDIDFNIRAGNTLVGFATREDVKRSVRFGTLDGVQSERLFAMPEEDKQLQRIEEKAADVDRLYKLFRQQQTEYGGEVRPEDKRELQKRLGELEQELNILLARQYGIPPSVPPFSGKMGGDYKKWLASHTPFHWFVEFYGIMNEGGFDVIIGNPPWVEFKKVINQYSLNGYESIDCNNLWAFVAERSVYLSKKDGRLGLIVPMSLSSTERMKPIQDILQTNGMLWISNFESESNPGQLFDGVKQNTSIFFLKPDGNQKLFTTRMVRFFSEERKSILPILEYVESAHLHFAYGFPKIGNKIGNKVLEKITKHSPLAKQISPRGKPIYVHRIAHYYIKCFNFVPFFKNERDGIKKSEDYKEYTFDEPIEPFVCAINSTLFYLYWITFFDGFKAGKQCVEMFPCKSFDKELQKELVGLCEELMTDLKRNSNRFSAKYSATGTIEYDQFFPRQSKPIIDEIDRALARHYGLSDEELDFIINYDIKYRMGKDETSEVSETSEV